MKTDIFWVSKEKRLVDPSQVGLLQLAIPLLLESILRSTVGLVDIAFLSRVSDNVVSAVSISNQYILFCQIIATSLAYGAIVCINQSIGMKDYKKVNLFATLAITTNTIFGIFLGILFIIAPELFLKIMKLDASSVIAASTYMRIAGGFMVFQCIDIALLNLCRSIGQIKAPLVINIISNIVNIIGNYLVIFHPQLLWNIDPVVGVALATVLSRVVAMSISVYYTVKGGIKFSYKHLFPFPIKELKLYLSIGIPSGFNMIAYTLGQIITTSIISLLGIYMITTKVYVTNIVQYVAIIGQAISSASAIIVGYRIGAAKFDEADMIRRIVTKLTVLSNAFISILMFLTCIPLLNIFTHDEQILSLAKNIFFIDFFVEIGRGLNNSVAGALQAAGDVKFQLLINQSSAWIVSVGGSYLLAIVFEMGLYGVWIAFACDELLRGLILLFRWHSKKWIIIAKQKREIIIT